MSDWLSFEQILGYIATALVILSFAQKSEVRFKIIISVAAFVFAIHFFLLGAFAGMAVAILNGSRTLSSMKFHGSSYMMVSFIVLYLIAGVVVYETPIDALPIFSGAVVTFAVYKLSGIKMRALFFCTELGWLIYAFVLKSVGGLITSSFVWGVNVVTIYRLFKDGKIEVRHGPEI